MKLTENMKQALTEINENIDDAKKLTVEQFINKYQDKSTTLSNICNKLNQYYNGDVKRNKYVELINRNTITLDRRKYTNAVYEALKVIYEMILKYREQEIFCLPIQYINKAANTSNMTAKKAINTLLHYNIIEFVGYTREHSHFAECQYKLLNIELLKDLVYTGDMLYDDVFNELEINTKLIENCSNIVVKNKEKSIKKAVNAMKLCPDLLPYFDESNVLDGYFKKYFLLDCKLRATSTFSATKNPEHLNDQSLSLRLRLLNELGSKLNVNYVEFDLNASIYTLSYYLKFHKMPNKYFYALFSDKIKENYNNTTPYEFTDKKLIKNLCMPMYMGGDETDSNYRRKVAFMKVHSKSELDTTLDYFRGHSGTYYDNDYMNLYMYIRKALESLCVIEKANIFLYESLLCSIIIKACLNDGYTIVNVYDGFYIPSELQLSFYDKYVLPAYEQVYKIYMNNKQRTQKDKNSLLLDYLEKNNYIETINERKFIKMMNNTVLVDFYNGNIIYR